MKHDGSASEIARLHDAISHYLQSNPNAADSLEGIMNWWLPKQGHAIEREESVYQALEQLIAEGVVKKVSIRNGTTLYKKMS